ncbi:MAG TPA: caspase family protein [Gemmatales bacterium]|nr:caspase family protein [Gemmatales bacterium]
MAKKPPKTKPGSNQRALVIGVSDYPNPKDRLPAVAADVREMAKVLSSKHGTFPAKGVTVMADKQATRDKVLAALKSAFGGAAVDTVFVYLAGHGVEVGGRVYYVAHDTTSEATAVPLTEIKALFEQTKSLRAFLWLDFCHSGGILARGGSNDIDAIRREIGVVSGHGKVIVAACTSAQQSFESSAIGHGLFTDALLRGLRGEAKNAQGEVTAHSLYEFIDHQVGSARQQPVFFGETTGRIVLAHYPERATPAVKKPVGTKAAKPKAKAVSKRSGTWVMLGDHFLLADTVRQGSDHKLEVKATTRTGTEAAVLAGLRPGRHGGGSSLPFAFNNEAHVVRVQNVESEAVGEKQVWTLSLTAEEGSFGNGIESSYVVNGKTYTPDDIARLRAGRILLNDPTPRTGPSRGFGSEDSILSWIEGSGRYPVKECVLRSVYVNHGTNPNWRTFARLKAVFLLRATGVVEHILDLTIGTARAGKVKVDFRGQRAARYSGSPSTTIEVVGACPVGA